MKVLRDTEARKRRLASESNNPILLRSSRRVSNQTIPNKAAPASTNAINSRIPTRSSSSPSTTVPALFNQNSAHLEWVESSLILPISNTTTNQNNENTNSRRDYSSLFRNLVLPAHSIDDINSLLSPLSFTNCVKSSSKVEHALNLLGSLDAMRTDRAMCDYEIRVNQECLYCHKNVLIVHSEFFRVMLCGSMRESRENYVDLQGFETANGVKLCLDYLYRGNFDSNESMNVILDMLEAASRLQITDLRNKCSDYLIKMLSTHNCVSTLKTSQQYGLVDAIDECEKFLFANIIDIYQNSSDQLRQLTLDQLKSLLKNDSLQVLSELDIFNMVRTWIKVGMIPSDKEGSESKSGKDLERLAYATELMQCVRFMCMSAEELADHVEKVDFMRTIPECNALLVEAYRYHALPKRQPLVTCVQARMRNNDVLVAIGEESLFLLNEDHLSWDIVGTAPLEENYPYPFQIITINNNLYVLGSKQTKSSNNQHRTCYRFSPQTMEWIKLAPMLRDRSRFGVAYLFNYIYVFGGFDGFKTHSRTYTKTIDRYSIEEDRWEEYGMEGPLLSSMASCMLKEIVYFGGGKNPNWSKVDDFYSIDLNAKVITKRANMLKARTTHQLGVINDQIYVFGGFDEAGNGILSIDRYDIDTNQWTQLTIVPGVVSKTWPQSIGILNDRFYMSVFFTQIKCRILQRGFFYNMKTKEWTDAPVINEQARYCHTCTLTFPRKILNAKSVSDRRLNA